MKLNPKGLLIFSISFIAIVALLLFLAISVPETQDIVSRLVFNEYTLALAGFLVISFLAYLKFRWGVKKQGELEESESFVEGAFKEKLVHRELLEWEKVVLEQKYRNSGNNKYDLDRRSPVFRIQGRIVQMPAVNSETVSLGEQWSVRELTINETNYPDIRFKSFKDFPEVVVEFSPFSKHVWDIYGIVGGKRVWSMYLEEKTFEFLDKEMIKIVVRASLAGHNLEVLKVGEIIKFISSKMGHAKFIEVGFIHHYPSLESLLQSENFLEIYPYSKSASEAKDTLNAFADYPDRIAKGGVYAIGIKYIHTAS